METHGVKPREQRWKEESSFFDEWANARSVSEISPLTLARYGSQHLRRRFSKEFRLRLIGDLRGKRVLDIGCGEGGNSTLFAKLGALVVGVDISPRAIELAKERARVNGVAGSVELYESSSSWRRGLANALATVDWAAMSLPRVRSLAATAVIYGPPVISAL